VVLGPHLPWVHPVDVVRTENHHDVGLLVGDQVPGLVDRVGRAGEPALAQALLRRHRGHVVAEQRREPPGGGDVPIQAVALVLGQHRDLEATGVDQVGQREVDQAVDPAERDRGLRPVRGQRHEPLALTPRQHDAQHLWIGHLSLLVPHLE
jgi:hypothetical protein